MDRKCLYPLIYCIVMLFTDSAYPANAKEGDTTVIRTWEIYQIVLSAQKKYENYYTDVTCWADLKGPDFSKRVYAFWDGGNNYVVRMVATKSGIWTWKCKSDCPDDSGLNNRNGVFKAVAWSAEEQEQNPNRLGFVQSTPNGHALQYADGTPFFLIGDTWLSGATWRLPFRDAPVSDNYIPGPGIGFEDAVRYRKNQGFNSVSLISCFPNWEADTNASTYAGTSGIFIRNAWEKFDYPVANGQVTAKDMRDEYGNKPFEMSEENPGVADFDRINPKYFQSLDKKIKYLSDQGFVPLIETVRRDNCPAWKATSDFNKSYARFVQYLISRYGAWNIIFSGIHLDWIPKEYSLTASEFNEALTYHLKKYGSMPFGQMVTTLIDHSTYIAFGHGKDCPWLTMHSVGNKPRDHRISGTLDTLFHLVPPYPAINFEPYYTGWNHEINMPNGERPTANSSRDNYFARAQMYGSVLSGGLSGHVHGTGAYDITSTGEPAGLRPHFWDALKYKSADYMLYLKNFIMSEGSRYQYLEPAHTDIYPRKANGSPENGLDGWSYMMRTPEKDFALLYFENLSVLPVLKGFEPGTLYYLYWYDPERGEWKNPVSITANNKGMLVIPVFPDKNNLPENDRAAKIIRIP